MTVADSSWPLVGRSEEISHVRKSLLHDAGGIFLVGAAGVGKTLIARHVSDDLAEEMEYVYLRGSAATAGIPYGALSIVLAQLDEETSANPLLLLSSLQARFGAGPDGRQTLMVLDNVEEFDDLSAMVIAHLARVGAVRLLGICEDMQRVPVELFNLWKDGIVQRLDVQALDLEKTTALLTEALGGPVSRSAALELWQASGGNPRYLQAAALAEIDSGQLALRDGVWVSGESDGSRPEKPIPECVTGQLERVSAEERPVLEAVAVAGAVPLELLLEVVPSRPVGDLQKRGLLRTDQGRVPLVHLASEPLAEALRSQLLSGPGRRALLGLNQSRGRGSMPAASRAALVLWCLGNGVDVDTPVLLSAAREANERFDAQEALRILSAVPEDASGGGSAGPEAALEKARALGISRNIDEALEVIAPWMTGRRRSLGVRLEVELMLTAARLMMRSNERHGEAQEILASVHRRLSAEPADQVGDLLELAEDFTAERELYEGRCAVLLECLPDRMRARLERGRPTHGLQGLLTSALALTGRQESAVEMGRSLMARLAGAEGDPLEIERAGTHLFTALLAAGYWNEALDMAAAPRREAGATIYDGSASEFTEGLLHAFAGRSQDALARLVPAISQLRARDGHGLLPLAEAAGAYVIALNGDPDAARVHLDSVDLSSERHSCHYRDSVEYFSILAEAILGEPGPAAERLRVLADANAAAGNKGQELLFLCQAVQLGRDDLVERLCAVAATSEGPMAQIAGLFGKGIASHNSELLLDAAGGALAMGDDGLAANAAERAIESLDHGDGMIGVYADQILRRAAAPARKPRNRMILSDRERKIARLVAKGASNRQIAEAEHVSVRTVEGHVHQILTKLGLSSRRQLALIFK